MMQEAGAGTARGGRDEVRLSSVAHPGTIPHLAHATPPLFLDAFLGKDNVSILSRATRKKKCPTHPSFPFAPPSPQPSCVCPLACAANRERQQPDRPLMGCQLPPPGSIPGFSPFSRSSLNLSWRPGKCFRRGAFSQAAV